MYLCSEKRQGHERNQSSLCFQTRLPSWDFAFVLTQLSYLSKLTVLWWNKDEASRAPRNLAENASSLLNMVQNNGGQNCEWGIYCISSYCWYIKCWDIAWRFLTPLKTSVVFSLAWVWSTLLAQPECHGLTCVKGCCCNIHCSEQRIRSVRM